MMPVSLYFILSVINFFFTLIKPTELGKDVNRFYSKRKPLPACCTSFSGILPLISGEHLAGAGD
jgi:hypothetical protein